MSKITDTTFLKGTTDRLQFEMGNRSKATEICAAQFESLLFCLHFITCF